MTLKKMICMLTAGILTLSMAGAAFAADTKTEETTAAEAEAETKEAADGEDTENEYTLENADYVLEAEQTDLTGKYGSGYSGSTTGTGMVIGDDTDNKTASNDYYVGWLYYPGAYLAFEFEAEEDLEDVTIAFRLSAQYNDVVAEGEDIIVGINFDEAANEYEQYFEFPMEIESYSEMSSQVKDFEDYVVAEHVTIKKGTNTIELMINNSTKGVGGTMKAAAPLVDCLLLFTDGEITPITYNSEFGG